jgi:serine/threonine protein kinase
MENQSAEDLFCDLMDLPAADRESALEAAAGLRPELRAEVLRLLRDAGKADAYFTGTAVAVKMLPGMGTSPMEAAGDMVGPYRLVRTLGEGGFGVVWEAEQSKPLKRTVAVKVIKAGMDSVEVLARFDAERQALARMDHPNIAKVLDAGMTETGRPYFAMELVEGRTITDYCREEGLAIQGRLRLFVDVCSAVNHAHQKGVIHRDIKPNNVLVVTVESKPVVKVIDFGIAKAIEGELTDQAFRTRAEQWVGTPVYMSPEQAGMGMGDLDTRSDIYALGGILYELLTGVPPFDSSALQNAGYEEMRRIIREEEPPRPSVRITTQGRSGSGENVAPPATSGTASLRSISYELDWVVMKALEKSKERRYDTAASLADDVERFLADEPVMAKPPTSWYLIAKFARRHRRAVQVLLLIAVILVAAVAISTWQALLARKAEQLAQHRLEEANRERENKTVALQDAEAVSRLLAEVFQLPHPDMDGRKVTVVEALDVAAKKLEQELSSQPERHAMLLEVLAHTYDGLALHDRSQPLRQRVLELHRSQKGDAHADSLLALRRLIVNAERAGNYEEVITHAVGELDLVAGIHGDADRISPALRSLARGYFRTEQGEKAIEVQHRLVEHASTRYGMLSSELSNARWEMEQYKSGVAPSDNNTRTSPPPSDTQSASDIEKATSLWEKSKQADGEDHEKTMGARMRLAQALWKSGQSEQAIAHLLQTLQASRKHYGLLAPTTISALDGLASMNFKCGKKEEAIRLQKELIHSLREAYGDTAPVTIHHENRLERYYFYYGPELRSTHIQFMKEQLNKRATSLGDNHGQTLYMRSRLVLPLYLLGQFEEGLKHAEIAVEQIRKSQTTPSYTTAQAMSDMARCLVALGRTDEAIPLLEESCPQLRDDTWVNFMLGNLYVWRKEFDKYNKLRGGMIDYMVSERGKFQRKAYILERAVWLCCQAPLENEDQAKALLAMLERAKEIRESPNAEPETYHAADVRAMITGYALYRTGAYQQALDQFLDFERLALSRKAPDPITPIPLPDPTLVSYKAMALHQLGKRRESLETFKEAQRILDQKRRSEQPLFGIIDTGGTSIIQWIAYDEAKALINPE